MAAGLLEVDGSIDIAQFWPVGSSDADTSQMRVDIAGEVFRFRPNDDAPFQVTHALDNARVKGSARQRRDSERQDHGSTSGHGCSRAALPADRRKEEEARVPVASSSVSSSPRPETLALAGFFQGIGPGPIQCTVRTAVDTPDEVFDTYGCLVGDIFVRSSGSDVDVNHWIVEHGWAYPAFYSSMSELEITTIVDLANQAFDGGLGVWPHLDDFARAAHLTSIWCSAARVSAPDPPADVGSVVAPKLFRRLAAYVVNKKAKMDLRHASRATCVRNGAVTACTSRRSS